jgi:glycosyltransferase involved in cell wall biosynthesis
MSILFIPHVPNTKVINRVYEFAKHSQSYILHWDIDNSSLFDKVVSQLRSLQFKMIDKRVQIPLLFKPESFAPKFNTYMLNRLIKKLGITKVVNANALLFDIASIEADVYYDMVDDHLEINPDIGLTESRIDKIKNDLQNAKGVICVTKFVEQKVKRYNSNTITIENGLYLERFQKAKSLKKELGLEGKKVFGYIGGVDEWTGLQKAIESYLKIKDDTNKFIVVGANGSTYYKNLLKHYSNDVVFIGSVAPEDVANYFKTLDIGLIPFECNSFTSNAMPIKALEYALAGANVVSTPLAYLASKKFDFVKFTSIESFSTEMLKIEKKEIVYDFSRYSWQLLSKDFIDFVEGD